MENMIYAIISVSIILLIILFRYIKKWFLNYGLFKKVGWIIAINRERDLPQRWTGTLLDEIIYKQQDLKIPKDFCLSRDNEAEKEHTEEILDAFKKDISELYFGGYLSNTQKIRNLQEDWYFMYRLFVFCERNSEYDNYKFREKIYKYESTDGSYSTYGLTDYGLTFYKLYLISLLYVEDNPYTRKLYEYIDPKLKEHLKSYIKTKNIKFWSYRP